MSTNKPKVTILVYRAPPESTTNVTLINDVCAAFYQNSWQVEMHAQKPKYIKKKSDIAGVNIIRYSVFFYETAGIWTRVLNGIPLATQAFVRIFFSKKPKLLIVDTTSPFLGIIGFLLHYLRGLPYIYLVTEVMPDAGIAMKKIKRGSLIDKAWRFTNRKVLSRASKIITIDNNMKNNLTSYLKSDSSKIEVVPNWADTMRIKPIARANNLFIKEHNLESRIIISYSGKMGLSHDLDTILETAHKLVNVDNIKFIFIGRGPHKQGVERAIKEKRLVNSMLLPWQSEDMLPYSLAAGDFCVVSLVSGLVGSINPSRTYPAMAAGQAIIAIMDLEHDIAQMVINEKIGISVVPGDVDKLANSIVELANQPDTIDKMKKRARKLAEDRFSKEKLPKKYEHIARQVASLNVKN